LTLSSLPPGWAETTIGSVVEPKVHQAPPSSPARYIEISGIDRATKKIVEAPEVAPADAPTRARQWVKPEDVLVSLTRPNLNAVALVPDWLDGAVASTGFDVLRANSVLPKWLHYRVRSQAFVMDVCAGLQGVVYPAIRPKDVRAHRFPLPPIGEQERLVEVLDSYFSRLDEVEAGLERAQRNLKRYRASVLQAAVTGRLVPTEAELARAEGRGYEPASELLKRILVERRSRWEESGRRGKYVEPAPPDTSNLPELPEGWCWASLDQLLVRPLSNGRSVPDAATGFAVLRLTCLRDGQIDLTQRKSGRWTPTEAAPFLVEEGDFLVARGNGSKHLVGRGGLVASIAEPVAFPDTLIRVRVSSEHVSPRLFCAIWNSHLVRSYIERTARTTAGIYKINQSDLEAVPIPLAPRFEQQRLEAEVERLGSVVQEAVSVLATQAARTSRLRQSILKSAFDGKLQDQESKYEPEAVILEESLAERATAVGNRKAKPARRGGRSR
jgi:type I restriction enzyme S subunit